MADFEAALGVTATAVRQRLNRLLDKGYIEKRKDPSGHRARSAQSLLRPDSQWVDGKPGRTSPTWRWRLWQEVRAIHDPEIRRGLMQRLAARLADGYRDRIEGHSLAERMESLAALFGERQIPFAVETPTDGQLPVLDGAGLSVSGSGRARSFDLCDGANDGFGRAGASGSHSTSVGWTEIVVARLPLVKPRVRHRPRRRPKGRGAAHDMGEASEHER